MDLLQQNHLRAWISSALAEAHRHHFDLSRRLPPVSVAQRLRREAKRLAHSASGYEQLVRHALSATADHGERAYRSLELRRLLQAPDPLAQIALRQRVLAEGSAHSPRLAAIATRREERRGRRRAGRNSTELALWLMEAPELHRVLWDHPALDVDAAVRAAMLASAARLEARARELSPGVADETPLSFPDPLPTRTPNQETGDGAHLV